MDRLAENLNKRGLDKHAFGLCKLRDIILAEAKKQDAGKETVALSKHASQIDALAKKAREMGQDEIAGELCEIRDAVQATAMDGPEGFQPVNSGEEGYPEDAQSEMAVPKQGEPTMGPQSLNKNQ